MGPNNKKQPTFDLDGTDDQASLPLGDVLHNADEMADHEEIYEEQGHE